MPPRKKEVPQAEYGRLTDTLGIAMANPVALEEEGVSTPKPDFFGDIQNYFTKGRPVTTDSNGNETYIQARFLSMAAQGFEGAAAYNRLSAKLPKWARAVVLYWLTPTLSRAPRMNYIKAEKGKETDAYKEVIQKIVNYFKCRPHHAPQIYDLLEAQKFDIYGFFGLKAPRGFLGSTGKEDDDVDKPGRSAGRSAGTRTQPSKGRANRGAGAVAAGGTPQGHDETGLFTRRRP